MSTAAGLPAPSGFNVDRFLAARYEARTERVPAAYLEDFFPEGEDPVIVIRGLTGAELNKSLEAGTRRKAVDAVAQAIATRKEEIAAVRQALGLAADTPPDLARRIEMLVCGSVSPTISHAAAAKIAEWHPTEFYDLTNRITNLTAAGGSRGKQRPSSKATPD